MGGAGGHRAEPQPPLRPLLLSGIRHPEEMSLLRAPEKKEKKKKEKEPEEEVYDLTKVILAGGECRRGSPGAATRAGPRGLGSARAWLTVIDLLHNLQEHPTDV